MNAITFRNFLDPHVLFNIAYFARDASVHRAFLYYKPYAALVKHETQKHILLTRIIKYYVYRFKRTLIYSPVEREIYSHRDPEAFYEEMYYRFPNIKWRKEDDNTSSYLILVKINGVDISYAYNRIHYIGFQTTTPNTLHRYVGGFHTSKHEIMAEHNEETRFIQHFIPQEEEEFNELRAVFARLRT